MKFVIQRVKKANVTIDDMIVGEINHGFMVLIGISENDTYEIADKMIRKLLNIRIFEDDNGKTNLSIDQVQGSLLLVSQFTLYADCKKGNRPSFIKAGNPKMASLLYDYIIEECKKEVPIVEKGVFGGEMTVSLVNEGPFTIILNSDEIV